jgi:hypothetical protein
MMKIIKAVLIVSGSIFLIKAGYNQNIFEVLFQSPLRKQINCLIEDTYCNFLGVGFQSISPNLQDYRGFIIKISHDGDTLSKQLNTADTALNLFIIKQYDSNAYLIIGTSSIPPDYGNHLMLMMIDLDLNPVWTKHFKYTQYSRFKSLFYLPKDDGFFIIGTPCGPYCIFHFPLFAEFNSNFDTLRTTLWDPITFNPDIYDVLYSATDHEFWLFTQGNMLDIGWPTRTVADTNFNLIRHDTIHHKHMMLYNTKWHSDTTFLFSSLYHNTLFGGPQDDEIGLTIYDKNLQTLYFNHFGAQDTIDYPAYGRASDFRHPDTINYAGTKKLIIGGPGPNSVSWIMTGQLDQTLQPRYQHFYGGDAYYMTLQTLATSDGGYLICAAKYNHSNQVYDIYFLKLNNEGLLVGNPPPEIPFRKALVWPNPASDVLKVQTGLKHAEIAVFRIDGTLVLTKNLAQGTCEIAIKHLPPGVYTYRINTPDGYVESGKFIKQ